VIAASRGFLAAAGVQVSQGRTVSAWAQARAAQVCLAGSAAARALGVTDVQDQPVVLINNEPCVVIGIVSRAVRRPGLLRSVLLPASTAVALWGAPDQRAGATPTVLIQTRPGAAAMVGRQAPYAISPARPDQFAVIVPMRPQRLRDQVTGTLTSLFFALGWVSLAIGTLSIASVTWLSVRERSAEYGLRRAVGARRRHILAHVIAESSILGLIGGLAGASLGVAAVILLARSRQWVPVIAPLTVLPAPLAGAAAGMLAGLIPGIRAARAQPAMALGGAPAS
jgi:putative ABC transport system permease protein